jgi:hypothetical protein
MVRVSGGKADLLGTLGYGGSVTASSFSCTTGVGAFSILGFAGPSGPGLLPRLSSSLVSFATLDVSASRDRSALVVCRSTFFAL